MHPDAEGDRAEYYSLEEAAAHAQARMPMGARMGLPASASRSSVASSMSSSSCGTSVEDDEPSLSRSLESTRSTFPVTPARTDFIRRLPESSHSNTGSPITGAADINWENAEPLSRQSTGANTSSDSDAQAVNGQSYPRSGPVSSSHRGHETIGKASLTQTPIRTSLGQSLGLSFSSKKSKSPTSGPSSQWESPLSQLRSNPDDNHAQQTFNVGPSNLAARRKLPPLAIRGSSSTVHGHGASMPHTPGGSVFAGARDGAASGGDTPVSPFVPPTPLIASRNGQPQPSPASSSVPVEEHNSQRRGSLPHLHSPLNQSSSMLRQGSLGPMSPLSREFAAVSVRSTPAGSTASGSSQDTFSSTSTLLTTPEMSPMVAPTELPEDTIDCSETLSRQSSGDNKNRVANQGLGTNATVGATRPKLSKSKTSNRVSPYPTRDGTLGSPKTPRKSEGQLKSSSTASLLTPPTMEKSLSAPAPTPAPAQTVSAQHLLNRQLHPDFAANYTIQDELGSGGFGFVVSATRNADKRPVAVKFIWKSKVPTHGWVRDPTLGVIPLEAFVLRVVDHPGVVKFINLYDDEDFFYLVMEMHGTPWQAPDAEGKKVVAPVSAVNPVQANASVLESPTVAVFAPDGTDATDTVMTATPSGVVVSQPSQQSKPEGLTPPRPAPMERRTSHDLFECIEQHQRFSEDVAAWIFAQIVEAVYYLSALGICHRDIKDENCVIDSDWNVKLIDFGSAVISDPRKPAPYFNRFFGTATFASAEILKGQQYRAPHAEVWSLGVLLSILLSGECPFSDPEAAAAGRISSRIRNSWSREALNLLNGCVQTDPDKRATIAQIREHPWVRRAWDTRGVARPSAPRIFERQ